MTFAGTPDNTPTGGGSHTGAAPGRRLQTIALERLDACKRLGEPERASLKQLAAELRGDPSAFVRWLAQASRHGELLLANPLGDGELRCVSSIYVGKTNFLRFDGAGQTLFVVQYLHTADALFLPARQLLIVLTHGKTDTQDVEALAQRWAADASGRAPAAAPLAGPFNGVITNAVSPYHFFYDCLPAFECAHAAGLLDRIGTVTALKGSHFFSIAELYAREIAILPVKRGDFEQDTAQRPGFFLLAGEPFRNLPRTAIRRLDDRLIAASLEPRNPVFASVRRLFSRSHPRIWIGLCSRKRAWRNEVEVLRALIAALAREYPRVFIVFDGITASIFPATSPAPPGADEAETMRRIMQDAPDNVVATDVIGRTSLEKIRAAADVDCFLSDYFTASMYPARMHRKPGLAWSGPTMLRASGDLHIHHRTRLLEPSAVTEETAPGQARSDHVDFRIDEAVFLREALALVRKA